MTPNVPIDALPSVNPRDCVVAIVIVRDLTEPLGFSRRALATCSLGAAGPCADCAAILRTVNHEDR